MASGAFGRRAACLVATLWVSACAIETSFSPPQGTQRFEPPAAYRIAWQQVEDCSGLRGNFDRVRWFLIPQPTFDCLDSDCNGLLKTPHDIYLSERAAVDSVGGYWTVRHEILHDLLGGVPGHPEAFRICGLLRS